MTINNYDNLPYNRYRNIDCNHSNYFAISSQGKIFLYNKINGNSISQNFSKFQASLRDTFSHPKISYVEKLWVTEKMLIIASLERYVVFDLNTKKVLLEIAFKNRIENGVPVVMVNYFVFFQVEKIVGI
jgi:hypothetical protein